MRLDHIRGTGSLHRGLSVCSQGCDFILKSNSSGQFAEIFKKHVSLLWQGCSVVMATHGTCPVLLNLLPEYSHKQDTVHIFKSVFLR